MRIISFIDQPEVIRRILEHLGQAFLPLPDGNVHPCLCLADRLASKPMLRLILFMCVPYSRVMGVSKAFIWFTHHPKEAKRYAGKHVAIVDDGVAAVADSPWQAYQKAKKKHPDKEPALTYIPEGDLLIL